MSSESSCWKSSVNASHAFLSVMMCLNDSGSGISPSSASSSSFLARLSSVQLLDGAGVLVSV